MFFWEFACAYACPRRCEGFRARCATGRLSWRDRRSSNRRPGNKKARRDSGPSEPSTYGSDQPRISATISRSSSRESPQGSGRQSTNGAGEGTSPHGWEATETISVCFFILVLLDARRMRREGRPPCDVEMSRKIGDMARSPIRAGRINPTSSRYSRIAAILRRSRRWRKLSRVGEFTSEVFRDARKGVERRFDGLGAVKRLRHVHLSGSKFDPDRRRLADRGQCSIDPAWKISHYSPPPLRTDRLNRESASRALGELRLRRSRRRVEARRPGGEGAELFWNHRMPALASAYWAAFGHDIVVKTYSA